MIEAVQGDVLAAREAFIIHGCNCQGVMGGGVAKAVREKFPHVYEAYRKKYETEGLQLGEIQIVQISEYEYIVNAMTQDNFGTHQRQVNYEAVARCFEQLDAVVDEVNAKIGVYQPPYSIVFPKIGAGLGGGNWKIISTIIEETVNPITRKVLYTVD